MTTSVYRYFDTKNRGAVNFSDFSYRVEELGLRLPRENILKMFVYLDSDQDNLLKLIDFVTLNREYKKSVITQTIQPDTKSVTSRYSEASKRAVSTAMGIIRNEGIQKTQNEQPSVEVKLRSASSSKASYTSGSSYAKFAALQDFLH